MIQTNLWNLLSFAVTHSNFSCEIGLRVFEPPIKIQGSKIINSVPPPEWFPTMQIIDNATDEKFLTLVTSDFVRINQYDEKALEEVLKFERNMKPDKRPYNTTIFYEVRIRKSGKEISVIASIAGLLDSLDETPYSVALEIYLKEKGKWLVHDFVAEKDWLLKFPLSNLEKMKQITSKDQELKLDVNGNFEPGL
ncbi:MAG: hypothetical protein R3F23_01230 [Verrucomicrobiia bacterium]